MTEHRTSPPPPTLGRYRVLRRLGAGGMAEVFLAKSTGAEGIEKLLVLKRVLPAYARSSKFLTMFINEAKVAMRLNHPNIVQVYAFEQVRDEFLLAMEYVDGLDLGRLVHLIRRNSGQFPQGVAALIAMEVAKGLDYAHNRRDEQGHPMDIVHRDVSPQNVLISYDGGIKIADFGIARARLVTEETGVIKGKFSYMSPEQARGERVDRRSDVYALGVLLAELLMGRPMYPGLQGLDVLEQVRQGKVTLPHTVNPSISHDLADIARRALAFDKEERFQTARSMAGALGRFLHQQDHVFDAETLERLLADIAPRESTSPGGIPLGPGYEGPPIPTLVTKASALANELRERRHVVVISAVLRTSDPAQMSINNELVAILSDIAFKADAVLAWHGGHAGNRFRMILGLGRPSVLDPLRSIRLSQDVLDALHGLSADLVSPLSISIGISRGSVATVRDSNGLLLRYDPVGTVLDVADSLAREANPDEVLVTGEIYRLTRRTFGFDDHPKELPAQEDRPSLRGYTLVPGSGGTDRITGTDGADELVGREAELRAIQAAYQEVVTTGRSAYIAITGDLGVGKTTLVRASIDSLQPQPRVIRHECAFGSADDPYQAVVDLLRIAAASADEAKGTADVNAALSNLVTQYGYAKPDRVRAARRGLKKLFGLERDTAPLPPGASIPPDGAEAASDIGQTVKAIFGALAAQGPIFLWLDAAQWADSPSISIMSSLFRETNEVPILCIVSSRPDERINHALSGIPRLDLAELEYEARRRLLRARFDGVQVPADIEQLVIDRAGGNPLFLVELIDALIDRGALTIESDGDEARVVRGKASLLALPATLEDVIAARMGELSEEARRLLRWLSVIGPGVRREDLSLLVGREATSSLDELCQRALVSLSPEDKVSFASAVVRQVAYQSTDPSDRVKMHRRVAAFLASGRVQASAAQLARHLEYGGDLQAAAAHYLRAAEQAQTMNSNSQALRFYGKALTHLQPDSKERFAAHEARELILRAQGHRRQQLEELEAMRVLADAQNDSRLRALAYARLARFELDQGRSIGVEPLLNKALEWAIDCGDAEVEVEVLRLTAQLAREKGDSIAALDACDRALARAGFDPSRLASRGAVLLQRGILLRRMGRLQEALEADAEALVIFRRQGLRRLEAQALTTLGVALSSAGLYEDALTAILASIALDREVGDRYHLALKLSNVGQLYAEFGDVQRAESFLKRALDAFHVLDDQHGRCDALCALAELTLDTSGDLEITERTLDEAHAIAERRGNQYEKARERTVRAAWALRANRFDQAEAAAREGADAAKAAGLLGFELLALGHQAEALSSLGKPERAHDTAERVVAHVRSRAVVERSEHVLLSAARAFGRLGDEKSTRAARTLAWNIVQDRLRSIRDSSLKACYESSPFVRDLARSLVSSETEMT